VVAARKTRTGKVGFLGGCPIPVVTGFEAGYRAGVADTRPDAKVTVDYLATKPVNCPAGFTDQSASRAWADRLYNGGNDVVFEVAGAADTGIFDSAKAHDALAIGSYTDQYKTVDLTLRNALLTSIVKRVDTVLTGFVDKQIKGQFTAGITRYGLGNGGLGYATSGDKISDLVPELDEVRQKIADGSIVVPDASG
jgi:basic membrane protein A